MKLTVNGESRAFSDVTTLTLDELLARLDITERCGVAVAVNNRVIPKSQWSEAPVADGDVVELIRATQGG